MRAITFRKIAGTIAVLLANLGLISVANATTTKLTIPSASVTSIGDDGTHHASTMVDGDTTSSTSYWASDAGTPPVAQWVQYDLGGCKLIDYFKIAFQDPTTRKYYYTLQLSKDGGTTWTNVKTGTSTQTVGLVKYDLSATNPPANKVRIAITGNTVSSWARVYEMEVWSAGTSTACGQPTPTAVYPADLLDGVSNWKLDTPLGPSNGSSNVLPAVLTTYTSAYFQLNTAKTGIIMSAPSDGSRTSSGTAYSRSELREMDGNDNTQLAAWNCIGTVNSSNPQKPGPRSMFVDLQLNKVTPGKRQASLAQIHDEPNDIVMVKYYSDTYSSDTKTDIGHIDALFNNSNPTFTQRLDSNYHMGDRVNITINHTVSGANGENQVIYTNVTRGTSTTTSFVALDDASTVGACFFKAGLYLAGCSKIDHNGEHNTVCEAKTFTAPDAWEPNPPNATSSELVLYKLTTH